MTSITHIKARTLLQAAADGRLNQPDASTLDKHLAECEQCRQYARSLDKLQDDLRRITRQRWSETSPQLSNIDIKKRLTTPRRQAYSFQMMGKFAIATVLAALTFMQAINFSTPLVSVPTADYGLSLTPVMLVHTPTPTLKGTVAEAAAQPCSDVTYIVQENDTLESIAARLSVPTETIKKRNSLAAGAVTPNMVLVIPLCGATPFDSTMTPTITTTATPEN